MADAGFDLKRLPGLEAIAWMVLVFLYAPMVRARRYSAFHHIGQPHYTSLKYRKWGWEIPNPAQGRRLHEPEGRMRWLTHAEAAALIRVAATEPQAPHLPNFIQLALNTGIRSSELLGLEWRRVDLNGSDLIFLEGHHTKADKRRSIPINEDARAALIQRARFRSKSQFGHTPLPGAAIKEVKGDVNP